MEFIIHLLKICTFTISDTDTDLKHLSYHFWRAYTLVLRVNLKLNPSAHGVHMAFINSEHQSTQKSNMMYTLLEFTPCQVQKKTWPRGYKT